MKVFDLHCDTVGECFKNNLDLYKNPLHFSLEKAQEYDEYCQVFAVWIPDELRGEAAAKYFSSVADLYNNFLLKYSDTVSRFGENVDTPVKAILACEGGSACGASLNGLKRMYEAGVRIVTLTWNGCNEIGAGAFSEGGITPFGERFIRLCEELGIIVDVSHLNRESFADVLRIAKKPFIASHSNADIVDNQFGRKRNLNDSQIVEIRNRGGLIGLNFCKDFLQQGEYPALLSLARQIEYLLSLDCEDVIALGSDFDGCEMIPELCGAEKLQSVYDFLRGRGIKDSILDKIFYINANNFFGKYITL